MSHMVLRVPPHVYFVTSAVFHYLGPALAVLLFARIDPLGAAWLRIATAALAFAMWRRPWRVWHCLDTPTRWLSISWAAVLAVMNSVFYLARFCAAWMPCGAMSHSKVIANNRFRNDCTR